MRTRRFIALAFTLGVYGGGDPLAAQSLATTAQGESGLALIDARRLLAAGRLGEARQVLDALPLTGSGGTEREFLDGMIGYASGDYRHAENAFRRILDRQPDLLRVRLELARTLFMEKEDEQADYHFRLAAAEHPPGQVISNIKRFREAIRARRALRVNIDFGFAPDTNINSATDKQSVDIYGLPFLLDPGARSKSGTGHFVGGDASLRLNRFGKMPIYLGGYGRWMRYSDHNFDDAYVGAEAGPEIALGGGHLRATATGLMRWYGQRPLVKSFGAHLEYERLVGDKWTLGGTLLVRRNDYAKRRDVDGWDAEARLSGSRALGATTLAFAYASVERNRANDPGQAYWREGVGIGLFKEIAWGLRPQVGLDLARQVHDGPLAPFGQQRRDWFVQGTFSIYKRDWNLGGLAPSLNLTMTRNVSTLSLYHEKRLRAEVRLTKAF